MYIIYDITGVYIYIYIHTHLEPIYIYIYVYDTICIYICIWYNMFLCIYIYMYVYIYMLKHIYICICICLCICIHTHMYLYTFIPMQANIFSFIRPIVFTEGVTELVLDGQDWQTVSKQNCSVRNISLTPRQRDAILKSFKFDIKLWCFSAWTNMHSSATRR